MINYSDAIPRISDGKLHWHPLTKERFRTMQKSDEDYRSEAIRRNVIDGRMDELGNILPDKEPFTHKELLRGPQHPEDEYRITARHQLRRKSELNPKPVDARTDAERKRDIAAERVEAERLEGLSPKERALEIAEKEVQDERRRNAIDQARKAALSTTKAISLHETLDTITLYAKYDSTVPQYFVEELEHMTMLLNKFGDVERISDRLTELQKQMLEDVRVEESHSRAVVDRIRARTEAILTGRETLDRDPEVYSDFLSRKHVRLSFLGETITIPFGDFDGRSESQLLNTHFNV